MVLREEKDFPVWVPSFLYDKRVAARRIFRACFAILCQGDRMETIKSSADCKLSASGMRGWFVQRGMGGDKGAAFRFEN